MRLAGACTVLMMDYLSVGGCIVMPSTMHPKCVSETVKVVAFVAVVHVYLNL